MSQKEGPVGRPDGRQDVDATGAHQQKNVDHQHLLASHEQEDEEQEQEGDDDDEDEDDVKEKVSSSVPDRLYINLPSDQPSATFRPQAAKRRLDDVKEDEREDEEDLEQEYETGPTQACRIEIEQQLQLTRDLLRAERHNNERRCQNNQALQRCLQQLQADFLRQQSDLVEALEFGLRLKAQKESQLECVELNLKQRDELIEQMKTQLDNLNETKLRQEFKLALEKQQQLDRLEQEQLLAQLASQEQQLCRERANNSQVLQQFQERLDDQLRLHESEMSTMRERLALGRQDLERVLSEPSNLVVKALREDKSRLENDADELKLALEEARNKYDSMKRRVESLLLEQEHLEHQNQEEVDKLQQLNGEQRRTINDLKLELEDRQEVCQVLQFNLQRSEKRVKNLLASLKSKEATYRELIGQSEMKQQEELDKLRAVSQANDKRLLELECECSKKQNELVRSQLEHAHQLEASRIDRDERVSKLASERQRLEKELRATELKLARECEQSTQRQKQVEQLQREVQQFRDEGKRLSIELTKSEAKLHSKQHELQALQQAQQQVARDLRQHGQADCDLETRLTLVAGELEEERNHSGRLGRIVDELKRANEKLCVKLRIAESNIDKMSAAISKEHERMMKDYESKLESIRSDQAAFLRNKLRYKRYGFKLKKYCEHLKLVHEHVCSPSSCGYIIGLASDGADCKQSTRPLESDGDYQLSNSSEDDDVAADSGCCGRPVGASNQGIRLGATSSIEEKLACTKSSVKKVHSPDRFIVKRTGLSPAGLLDSSPLKTRHSLAGKNNSSQARAPLRTRSSNSLAQPSNQTADLRTANRLGASSVTSLPKVPASITDEHSYYYIKYDSRSLQKDKHKPSRRPEEESAARRVSHQSHRPVSHLRPASKDRRQPQHQSSPQERQNKQRQQVFRAVI